MNRRVSDEMNYELNKPFSENEVRIALEQMHPYKSPGPDGMSTCFYQRYWSHLRQGVGKVIVDCLNNRGSLAAINHTNVILIPKKKNDNIVQDFQPISLCNVSYKLISKVLVNRM